MQDLNEREAQVEQHIRDGETEQAVQGIVDLVRAYCKNKDFLKAEALRDRLYEIDPLAISEIVLAGDIIEQEKSASLDRGHLEKWSELYNRLSTEEKNELYFCLESTYCDPDQALFQAGEENTRLFLLEQGEIKLSYHGNGREIYIKTCSPGEIQGAETFFRLTNRSTYTAKARTPVQVSLLHQSALTRWEQEYPNLVSELYNYCFLGKDIAEIIRERDADRRSQQRIQVDSRLKLQVLNESGKPLARPFGAEMINISSGGLAFTLELANSKTAQKLLSRRIALKANLPIDNDWREIKKAGRIVGIRALAFNEYSFHVQFEKPLPEELLERIQPGATKRSRDLDIEL